MANSAAEPEAKKGPERPWMSQDTFDAIVGIYDKGCTRLSRIVGEMAKCGFILNTFRTAC